MVSLNIMKIAAIDVGSNSCRLCIREVKQSGKTKKILNLREPLRLGTDSFSRGSFSPKMMNQGMNYFG